MDLGSDSRILVTNPKSVPAASQAGPAPSQALTPTLTQHRAHSDSSCPARAAPALTPPPHGHPAACQVRWPFKSSVHGVLAL